MSIDFEPIPIGRTIVMVNGPNGLVGERALAVRVDSEGVLYALEYRNDMGVGQKMIDIEAPVIVDGTEDGLTFATGKRGTQAKLRISASVADEYTVRVRVKYGGDWRAAHIIVKAA